MDTLPLSKLNFHKFKHNFRDALNPMCPSSDGIEDAEHFLLLCPSFDAQRRDLLAGVYDVLRPFGHSNLSNEVLTHLYTKMRHRNDPKPFVFPLFPLSAL